MCLSTSKPIGSAANRTKPIGNASADHQREDRLQCADDPQGGQQSAPAAALRRHAPNPQQLHHEHAKYHHQQHARLRRPVQRDLDLKQLRQIAEVGVQQDRRRGSQCDQHRHPSLGRQRLRFARRPNETAGIEVVQEQHRGDHERHQHDAEFDAHRKGRRHHHLQQTENGDVAVGPRRLFLKQQHELQAEQQVRDGGQLVAVAGQKQEVHHHGHGRQQRHQVRHQPVEAKPAANVGHVMSRWPPPPRHRPAAADSAGRCPAAPRSIPPGKRRSLSAVARRRWRCSVRWSRGRSRSCSVASVAGVSAATSCLLDLEQPDEVGLVGNVEPR